MKTESSFGVSEKMVKVHLFLLLSARHNQGPGTNPAGSTKEIGKVGTTQQAAKLEKLRPFPPTRDPRAAGVTGRGSRDSVCLAGEAPSCGSLAFPTDEGCCCRSGAPGMSDPARPRGRQRARLLRPWDSPGKNIGVACHFLLQLVIEARSNAVKGNIA